MFWKSLKLLPERLAGPLSKPDGPIICGKTNLFIFLMKINGLVLNLGPKGGHTGEIRPNLGLMREMLTSLVLHRSRETTPLPVAWTRPPCNVHGLHGPALLWSSLTAQHQLFLLTG